MITITCTKCQATLEMDDAFAGGVCRCQHCGTIQTVPSHLKQGGRPAEPALAGNGTGPKALFPDRGRAAVGGGSAVPSSGLDDLATAVASSGISSGLSASRRPSAPPVASYATPALAAKPTAGRTGLFVALGAFGGVVVLGLLAYLFLAPGTSKPAAAPPPAADPAQPVETVVTGKPSAVAGPHFLTLSLADAKRVVFVIDRGNSSQEVFDPLKAALYESLASLGPQREFQVLFWTADGAADGGEYAYPKGGTARGNRTRIDDLRREIEDVSAGGATDVGPAVREAMRRDPDAVVIATAKGIVLDDPSFVTPVMDARGPRPVVIHTINLDRGGDGRAALEAVAQRTGGKYLHVTPGEIRAQ